MSKTNGSDGVGLSEQGKKEAQTLIDNFKKQLTTAAEYAICDLYVNILPEHIEGDAWINYREQLRAELEGKLYKTVTDSTEGRWAQQVRAMILHEHKEALVGALNHDLQVEIDRLKNELKLAYERRIY